MELHKNIPVLLFLNVTDWESWLHANNNKYQAIWLKFAKKNTGAHSINYDEALQIALCYGWIDGLINKYDEMYYLTRFTPRKAQSVWSKGNRELAQQLIKQKKMKPSGLKTIESAMANGNWDSAYDGSKTITVPKEFLTELAKDKSLHEFYTSLNKANLYAIAWRMQTAKTPEIQKKGWRRFFVC